MRKWWIFWPLYAGLMGFALGASLFFGLYGRNVTESSTAAHQKQESANETTKSKKDETDEAIAFYTLWLMAFTGILAFATIGLGGATILLYATGEKQFKFAVRSAIRQAKDTKLSIAVAQKSAEAAERSLIAANRPWIKVDLRAGGPIHYNDNGANFTLIYVLKNIGNSPALNVEVRPRVINFLLHARTELLKDVEAWKKFDPRVSFGPTLFPGEVVDPKITVFMSHEQIKEATKLLPALNPTIIGSVTYRTGLDNEWHQTGFAVQIRRDNRPRPFTTERNYLPSGIWIEEGDVPAEDVRLVRSITHGGYAD
jgi:hypothetical protein